MNLTFCTLTGVDQKTDLRGIAELSTRYPIAEWGFLFSPKHEGTPGRYPSYNFLRLALHTLDETVNMAVHVCGNGVYSLLEGAEDTSRLLSDISERSGRLQLNFSHARKQLDLSRLRMLIQEHPNVTFITQMHEGNHGVWQELEDLENHAVLFDSSGGRGVSPESWPKRLPIKCGYAGGLGVSNLKTQLPAIHDAAAGEDYWIDMEGSLRDQDREGHDWLNLDRCEEILKFTTNFACR